MSYQYQSFSQTITTTTVNGETNTRTTTRTTTKDTDTGTSSSVVIRELTEGDLSDLTLESTRNYEISDEDRLTQHDFYSLMNTEDEASESDSESDVEHHWFPSLLKTSFIEFLDDDVDDLSEIDTVHTAVQIEEHDDTDEIEEDTEEIVHHKSNGKRSYHHSKRKSKRPRKSEQVPIEVIHIIV